MSAAQRRLQTGLGTLGSLIVIAIAAVAGYYIYLGVFAGDAAPLTMGTTFVYMYFLLNDADTSLKRVIALAMMLVGVVGELITAGFGMQVEAWARIGYIMTTDDVDLMVLIIRILMGAQGIALLTYFTGDRVVEMFRDEDGDGIPNAFDKDYKGGQQKQKGGQQSPNGYKPVVQYPSEVENPTEPPRHK